MPAHIVERLHGPAAVAQDDQVVTPDLTQKIIAGVCKLGGATDTHPALSKNMLNLRLRDGIRCVVLAGESV